MHISKLQDLTEDVHNNGTRKNTILYEILQKTEEIQNRINNLKNQVKYIHTNHDEIELIVNVIMANKHHKRYILTTSYGRK